MVIYQIFTRLFGNKTCANIPGGTLEQNGSAKMNDIDDRVLRHIAQLGISHVWYTGVIRHATQTDYSACGIPRQHPDVVKGKAGSPYAIADYYDIDPDLAEDVSRRMEEFQALVERTHRQGMKVVVDFVPNHVARQYQSIARPAGVRDLGEDDNPNVGFSWQNNFYYLNGPFAPPTAPERASSEERGASINYIEQPARATGNDCFTCQPSRGDWYETVKLNYGIDYLGGHAEHFDPIPDTWRKMLDILMFWAAKGIDGFRCDMVFMVPVAFWRWAIPQVKAACPAILFIGEIYDPAIYRDYIAAGFDYLYDKVGMYDCLHDIYCHGRRAADITYQWQATDDISGHMLRFLENHDEQRFHSPFFAANRSELPALLVSALLQKGPFMLYFGQEVGEQGMDAEGFSGRDGRTTIFDYWHLPSIDRAYFNRRKLTGQERSRMELYQKVLNMKERERAFSEGMTFDLMYVNPHIGHAVFAFLRKHEGELMLVVANFSDQRQEPLVNIPRHAFEVMGIDEGEYGATDLLTGESLALSLKADGAVNVSVEPWGGRVYKMNLNEQQ